MKGKLTSVTALIIMLLTIEFAKAQLSGSYTIGGITPDYATISAAVSDLNLQGISAPVVFNIRDGIYIEKVVLTTVPGATFTNTVTFQSESGDSSLVTITSPTTVAPNFTISMTGADYITFHQLTLERSGVNSNSRVIELAGGCDYNNFTNCLITTGNISGTNAFGALVYAGLPGGNDNYNVFMNNRLVNGAYDFYFSGISAASHEDGNMIMNNEISNPSSYGVYAQFESNLMVSGNHFTTTNTGFGSAFYGTGCSTNLIVFSNKIYLPDGGVGISLLSSDGGLGTENLIANNFITVGNSIASTQAYGIKITDCSNTGVYFNSVNITANVTNNACFNATSAASTNMNVMNNVFVSDFAYLVVTDIGVATQMDYNDLYTTGFNFCIYNTTPYNNLAAWQAGTGLDINSINADPGFVSPTDLHVSSFVLNGLATPIANITTDIDGDSRDLTAPDMGADEFPAPSFDVGVIKIVIPYNNLCQDSLQMVAVIVKNYSAISQTNVTVDVQITGFVNSSQTAVITNTIGVLQHDTAFFALPVNTLGGGILNISAYTSQLNDEDNSNDTLAEVDTIRLCLDAGVTKIISPYNNSCGDSLQMIAAVVKNFADAPQINVPVEIQITGFVNSTQNVVLTGPIPVGGTDTAFFALPINTLGGGILNVSAYTSQLNDEDNSNDTLAQVDTVRLCIDAGVTKILSPYNNSCGDSLQMMAAVVKNFTDAPQINIPVEIQVTGFVNSTQNVVLAGPIPVGGIDTAFFALPINTYAGGVLNILCFTSLVSDENIINDTLAANDTIIAIPQPPVVPDTITLCEGNNGTVNAAFPANQQVYWYDSQFGGNLLYAGNPFIIGPTSDTTYYAEVQDTTFSVGGCLRITECEPNGAGTDGDYVEVQNLSGNVVDATGWVLAVNGQSYTNINLVNPQYWNLGMFAPGEIQYRCDACTASPNYFGANIYWTGGATYRCWAAIIDNLGQVRDFISWGYDAVAIQSFNVTINGFAVTIGSEWVGNGAFSCTNGTVSRIGITDNNDSLDWACEPATPNTQNVNLASVLTNGEGCPSPRVPVVVDVLALPTVFLGNDTTIAAPNTVTLDAGAGFATYLWSDGSSTQTIIVSVSGTHTVTVTDANGCTGSDVILITVLTGINDFGSNSEVILRPVPATDYLKVTLKNMKAGNYAIALFNNISQRIITSNVSVQNNISESTFNLRGVQRGIYYVEVKSDNGIYHQRILIQ